MSVLHSTAHCKQTQGPALLHAPPALLKPALQQRSAQLIPAPQKHASEACSKCNGPKI